MAEPSPAAVPAGPSIRHVRCLQAQGWDLDWQATRLHVHPADLAFLHTGPDAPIDAALAARIAALAAELGDQRGTSAAAAAAARAAGWYPAICYDEDTGAFLPWAVPGRPRRPGEPGRPPRPWADPACTDWDAQITRLALFPDKLPERDTAALLGITERLVRSRRRALLVRAAPHAWKARGLQAQGWPRSWLLEHLTGQPRGPLPAFLADPDPAWMLATEAATLDALAAQVRDDTGPSPGAAAAAAKRLWHPLACHDPATGQVRARCPCDSAAARAAARARAAASDLGEGVFRISSDGRRRAGRTAAA